MASFSRSHIKLFVTFILNFSFCSAVEHSKQNFSTVEKEKVFYVYPESYTDSKYNTSVNNVFFVYPYAYNKLTTELTTYKNSSIENLTKNITSIHDSYNDTTLLNDFSTMNATNIYDLSKNLSQYDGNKTVFPTLKKENNMQNENKTKLELNLIDLIDKTMQEIELSINPRSIRNKIPKTMPDPIVMQVIFKNGTMQMIPLLNDSFSKYILTEVDSKRNSKKKDLKNTNKTYYITPYNNSELINSEKINLNVSDMNYLKNDLNDANKQNNNRLSPTNSPPLADQKNIEKTNNIVIVSTMNSTFTDEEQSKANSMNKSKNILLKPVMFNTENEMKPPNQKGLMKNIYERNFLIENRTQNKLNLIPFTIDDAILPEMRRIQLTPVSTNLTVKPNRYDEVDLLPASSDFVTDVESTTKSKSLWAASVKSIRTNENSRYRIDSFNNLLIVGPLPKPMYNFDSFKKQLELPNTTLPLFT